jgi:hypothetical protein
MRRLPRTTPQFQRAGLFVHYPAGAGQRSRGFSWPDDRPAGRIDCAGAASQVFCFLIEVGNGLFCRSKQSGIHDAATGCSRGWPRDLLIPESRGNLRWKHCRLMRPPLQADEGGSIPRPTLLQTPPTAFRCWRVFFAP